MTLPFINPGFTQLGNPVLFCNGKAAPCRAIGFPYDAPQNGSVFGMVMR
jgi:hypothetical protein